MAEGWGDYDAVGGEPGAWPYHEERRRCRGDASAEFPQNLCEGCQEFRDFAIDFDSWAGFPERKTILLHRNYTELSECADATCALCQFFRRELWFDNNGYFGRKYHFRNSFEAYDSLIEIAISAGFTKINFWQLLVNSYPGGKRWFRQRFTKCDDERKADLSTEQLLGVASKWLTTCSTEHKFCVLRTNSQEEAHYVPSRLLDIGSHEESLIRLVETDCLISTAKMSYVTLSYCWGVSNAAACTTKENISTRMTSISMSTLPQTICDAILVTRALGVKYLWVDALCIIQVERGENEDWQRELPNMGKIYGNSLLTIAASSGRSSDAGLFRRLSATCWPVHDFCLCGYEMPHIDTDCIILEATKPSWDLAVEESPLSNRGWVLQERMLAPRTLFWTEEGLFWQCRGLRTSEYGVCDGQWYPDLHEIARDVSGGYQEEGWRRWLTLLERFSNKILTIPSDRGPAVMGLARQVESLTGKEYKFGVFTHDLIAGIAWVAGVQSETDSDLALPINERRPETRAEFEQKQARFLDFPSWSWASISGEIFFRGWDVITEGLATGVRLVGSQIHACGKFGRLIVKKLDDSYYLGPHRKMSPSPCTFAPIRPDADSELLEYMHEIAVFDTVSDALQETGGTILCAQWSRWEVSYRIRQTYWMIGAIILSPVDESRNTYRRIGWLEIEDDSCFDNEPKDFILI